MSNTHVSSEMYIEIGCSKMRDCKIFEVGASEPKAIIFVITSSV